MTNNYGTAWTDERIEQLKVLWAQGFSCSQIAKIMGGITRSSVIGKAHRLGLDQRRDSYKRVHRPIPRTIAPVADEPTPNPEPIAVIVKPPALTPEGKPITLANVGHGQCTFPLWPDHGPLGIMQVCGQNVAHDPFGPYCEAHRQRVFAPQPKRRNAT